jgi:signal peptidase I
MSPTLEKGERILYHKRANARPFQRGTIIVYKLSPNSAWGQPGWLVISRILAIPGDRLSIQDGKYLVNGELGAAVAETGTYAPVVAIPTGPEAAMVPEDCYFIIQDSPQKSFDSRVLSWVKKEDIVSTELYYVSGRGILKPVP